MAIDRVTLGAGGAAVDPVGASFRWKDQSFLSAADPERK